MRLARVDRADCRPRRNRSERVIPLDWRGSRPALWLPPHDLVRHIRPGPDGYGHQRGFEHHGRLARECRRHQLPIGLRDHPENQRLSVAIMTSSDHDPDISRAYALGADSYLIKPPDAEALLALVQRLHAYWVIVDQPLEICAQRIGAARRRGSVVEQRAIGIEDASTNAFKSSLCHRLSLRRLER